MNSEKLLFRRKNWFFGRTFFFLLNRNWFGMNGNANESHLGSNSGKLRVITFPSRAFQLWQPQRSFLLSPYQRLLRFKLLKHSWKENQGCCTSAWDLFKDAPLKGLRVEEKKSPGPGRIWTHVLFVTRRVLNCCATTAARTTSQLIQFFFFFNKIVKDNLSNKIANFLKF